MVMKRFLQHSFHIHARITIQITRIMGIRNCEIHRSKLKPQTWQSGKEREILN